MLEACTFGDQAVLQLMSLRRLNNALIPTALGCDLSGPRACGDRGYAIWLCGEAVGYMNLFEVKGRVRNLEGNLSLLFSGSCP